MNNFSWKKVLPHIIAFGVFLIIALVYGRQSLSGNVLQQSDVIHWQGMSHESEQYKEAHGHYPLWNTRLFSGMPNYQIDMGGKQFMVNFTNIFTLGLPQPVSFFFLACICFYILTQVLRLRPVVGILGSLAFSYATFNSLIIVAGHITQMLAIAYMPAVIAGVLLLYEKRYAIGIFVTTLFATCEVMSNHPQVTYYCFVCIGIISIFYIVKWVKAGQIKHTIVSLLLVIAAIAIAVGNTALVLLPTYDYAKYSIRGGSNVTINDNGKAETTKQKSEGLSTDYAFQYSLGKAETFALAMPNAFGGGTGDGFDEESDQYNNAAQIYQQVNGKLPPQQVQMLMQPLMGKYWGGILPSTAGPFFIGTLIVLLSIIGFFVVKSKHRWWLITATAFFILLAWGGYFTAFNEGMFKIFPFYNKFRAPSMAMIIPDMLLVVMASITIEKLFFEPDAQAFLQKNFKKILYVLGGFIVLALLVYVGNDYSLNNNELKKYILQLSGGGAALSGLESARKAMFMAGIGRLILFSLFIVAGIFLYMKKIVTPVIITIVFLGINSFDLFHIDSKYLNSESYMPAEDAESQVFAQTSADQAILQDKSLHYRVFNLSPSDGPFNDAITSYYHRSIGGYNAAKLGIYQNLIESQMRGEPNNAVLNMLDTKYLILPAQGKLAVQKRPDALGAAWFVKNISYVPDDATALNSLSNFNPKDTAIVVGKSGTQPVFDSAATIQLKSYDNDAIQYSTNAKSPQFAVLSEIYYPGGWNAYIDGKKTDYVQTNYVLRGINVPAGNHQLEFKFEPRSFSLAQTIVLITNSLFWLFILVSLFLLWKQSKLVPQTQVRHES